MTWTRILVVFSGQADLWWLRLLKPGFRHCFVALAGTGGWVVVEPLSHRTEIMLLPLALETDLADWYRRQGLTVVDTMALSPLPRMAPWRPYSCVESVKRILGIHAGNVLTPWQLFRYIEQNMKIIVDASGS